MFNYTIIEDCSPFYIRYTYKELGSLVDLCNSYPLPKYNGFGLQHLKLDAGLSHEILKLIPVASSMPMNQERISLFLTEPGFYYGPHKDGMNYRFGLNFMISVLDDKCVTSWYSDDDLSKYEVSTEKLPSLKITIPNKSREILGFDKKNHIPVKTTTFKESEAILFNTDLFHDFDNSTSSNRRLILTLRHANPENVYFEDARKMMFGY